MNEIHTISVQASNGTFDKLTVEIFNNMPYKLKASGVGFLNREFIGKDLFEALITLRLELEKAGYRILCGGARIDAYPSGMARSMGGARKVYVTQMGKQAVDMIDIFDEANPVSIGTVEQQKEFHFKWIHSLKKSK